MTIGGILLGTGILTLCIASCMCKRINLAMKIIELAAIYVKDTKSAFVLSPIFLILLLIWFTVWVVTTIFLLSIGEVKPSQNTFFVHIERSQQEKIGLWYFLFGLFWIGCFITALNEFIQCMSVVIW